MFGLHPVTVGIVGAIVGQLALAPLIFLALGATGKLTPALKADLWTRWRSWLIITPAMIVPVLAGRIWTILAITILGLLCHRDMRGAIVEFDDQPTIPDSHARSPVIEFNDRPLAKLHSISRSV